MDCTFTENRAIGQVVAWISEQRGGAIIVDDPQASLGLVLRCTFNGNIAYSSGGAIYVNEQSAGSMASIIDSTFIYNKAANYFGGAISIKNANGLEISNCNFLKNEAYTKGAALHFPLRDSDRPISIINSTFKNECDWRAGSF